MISFVSVNRLIHVRTVTLLVFLLTAANAFAEPIVGKVVRVLDGDTLVLLANKTEHKIQLAEIDAPEKEQPWGSKAKQALS
ncbi:MAG: thermonuclease family protein, partial [Gammaproteobacteria bacterium]|nr:thermonuclease family protein [Gammaproteobacteria bacterium]